MEIAPLIHSRTFYCDFNQNFAVRPSDLNVQWAMNKILPAMRDVDILEGVRRVVATDGKLCIAGVACNFRYFVDNYLSTDERAEAANYLHDERGRDVKIFLGYAFKGSDVPDVSDSKLWQMFKQTLAPEWKRESAETVFGKYESCGTKSVGGKKSPVATINGIAIYETDGRGDKSLFEQCLAERKNFCSNVDAIKIAESGEFDIIAATRTVINRLQAEAQKKTQPSPPTRQNQSTRQQPFQSQRTQNPKLSSAKEKKSSSTLIIGVIVLAILAAIAFLVMSPQSEESEERNSRTSMNCAPTLKKITAEPPSVAIGAKIIA